MGRVTVLAATVIAITLLFAGSASGAGTCTSDISRSSLFGGPLQQFIVAISCTADAADGSFPDVNIPAAGGNLIAVYVVPGVTAPTSAAYDITVTADDMGDIDLLGGAGADIVTTADSIITPQAGTVSAPTGFFGDITVSQAGNAVNSATVDIYLVLAP